LAGAQVFALSSEYEGFPNAMLEAMSIGLACVAFDCPSGPRDLSDNGEAAIIVPPGDQQRFTQELRKLMHDAAIRASLGAAGAIFVRRRYSEQAVMTRWNSLLAAIIHRRSPEVSRTEPP
jgi:glycosyltransferase involved in cell wall biosynthesis